MPVDWSSVEQARTTAQTAGQSAVEFGARSNTLADELRKAIGERFAESPVAKESATARANFLQAAPQARADVLGLVQGGSILSPTQQNAILASKRASALVPLMASNVNQEAMFGTMQDLINAGVNAYRAEAERKVGLASLAQGNYSTLLNELMQKASYDKSRSTVSGAYTPRTTLAKGVGDISRQRSEIAAYFATDVKDRVQAESSARSMIQQGYDQKIVYDVMNEMFPKEKKTTSKYNEQQKADFINAVASGSLNITNIPQEIRGEVQSRVDEINASKPWWQKLGNFFQ